MEGEDREVFDDLSFVQVCQSQPIRVCPGLPLRFLYVKKEPFRSSPISANELEDVAGGA